MCKKVGFPSQLKTENISNDKNRGKNIRLKCGGYALIRVMCWTGGGKPAIFFSKRIHLWMFK